MKKEITAESRGRKLDIKTVRRAKKLYGSKKPGGGTMSYRDVARELGKDVRNIFDYVNMDLESR